MMTYVFQQAFAICVIIDAVGSTQLHAGFSHAPPSLFLPLPLEPCITRGYCIPMDKTDTHGDGVHFLMGKCLLARGAFS